tara:strand:+ start:7068 stop:7283 length:216 start_codon:yes stop_codon:yes gene_type:complete
MKKKREELIEKAALEPKHDHLVFSKDIEFGSPSTVGSVVRGVCVLLVLVRKLKSKKSQKAGALHLHTQVFL